MAVRLWDAHYSLEDCIPLSVSDLCYYPRYRASFNGVSK